MIIPQQPLKTESEWLAAVEPGSMLEYLWQRPGPARSQAGRRKLRLFACACCRRAWHLLSDDVRQALQTCEQYADGLADERQRRQARSLARAAAEAVADREESLPVSFAAYGVWSAAQATVIQAAWGAKLYASNALLHEVLQARGRDRSVAESRRIAGTLLGEERRQQSRLLRECFGNPFRPVAIDPGWLTWHDATIPRLAQAIDGECAFDRLPILADALEDAGCTDPDILNHCRQPGDHLRGCWVLDLLRSTEEPLKGQPVTVRNVGPAP
jgi:hypothetical protein